jgi:hypothetical protein
MADSARLVTGVSPGRSWNFASRSGPLMTAVVRWSMPQLCPKITSLPAQSPYILSRGAGLPPADPGAPSLQAVPALSPTANSRPSSPPCRRGSRWPPGRSGDGGQRSPVAEVADRLCTLPFPYQRNKLSKLVLGPAYRCGRGRFSANQVPPESEPGLDPGLHHATALETRRRAQPCRCPSAPC